MLARIVARIVTGRPGFLFATLAELTLFAAAGARAAIRRQIGAIPRARARARRRRPG